MQRPIKFRAWDAKNKKIVTSGLSINIDTTGRAIPVSFAQGDIAYCRDNDVHSIPDIHRDITLMQYTGLKSKSGVEIYEGNIVKMHQFLFDGSEVEREHIGHIEWINSDSWSGGGVASFGVKLIKGDFFRQHTGYDDINEADAVPMHDFYGLHEESFEVIGNIYENPDLLTQDPKRAD